MLNLDRQNLENYMYVGDDTSIFTSGYTPSYYIINNSSTLYFSGIHTGSSSTKAHAASFSCIYIRRSILCVKPFVFSASLFFIISLSCVHHIHVCTSFHASVRLAHLILELDRNSRLLLWANNTLCIYIYYIYIYIYIHIHILHNKWAHNI